MKFPQARVDNIIEQELDKELLLYNLQSHKALSLNETAKTVFQACDGRTTFAELKTKHNLSDELIYLTLEQLQKEGLLANGESFVSPLAGMNRREIIRRIGLTSIAALPLISALIAPTAANAQSSGGCFGGGASGSRVSTTGNGNGDAAASADCLNKLNCSCASGRATGSIGFCAGAPTSRACTCNGTCA